MSIGELIKQSLTALGADGLCNPDQECGCGIEDLAPCDNLNLQECVAAKWHIPKQGEPEYEDEVWRDGYYKALEEKA